MAQQTKTFRSKYQDQGKLNKLAQIVVENIGDIYDYFDAKNHRGAKVHFSTCFIHGGDNTSALNLYYDADFRVHYKCRTHACEKYFGTSVLSMIRGGLSHTEHGWVINGDKTVTFDQTVEFLLNRYKLKFWDIKGSETAGNNNHEFCKVISALSDDKIKKSKMTRTYYRSKVEIPSHYYLKRGFSIEVLDDYDVGTCKTFGKPLYNRAIVPVYDHNGETIIGFTGRSIFEKCGECRHFHDPNKNCHVFPKWRHTNGFQKEKILYNYNRAKEHILESGVIILVESPGNVWRLEESGVHNSVALFGVDLSIQQKRLIDESGALTIILIMDNDDNQTGQEGAKKIKEQCEKTYRVYTLDISKNDIGEMSTNEVTEDIKPWIDKAKELYN